MPFPLPLVPFETYMLAEDTATYPRAFVIEVRLSGNMQRAALEQAWQTALVRHPMLKATLAKRRGKRQWIEGSRSAVPLDWQRPEAPLEFDRAEFIDLDREPGVRLWVRADDQAARLVLQFHHACCDGVGGLQFIGDLLAAYATQVHQDQASPKLSSLENKLLAQRGNFGTTKPTLSELIRDVRYVLSDALRLVGRRSLSVNPPSAHANSEQSESVPFAAGTKAPFPALEIYTFSADESQEIRGAARGAGATLNDLLMCCWFQALDQWNAQAGERSEGWLRINVPTSLRRREHESMPAANVMSFTFVDRHTDQCGDTRALLDSIRRETEAIRHWRLGLSFIAQMSILATIPGGLRFFLGGQRCLATAVLTNLGDPSRRFNVRFPRRLGKVVIGNLTLENIAGVPPLRPLTRAGVGVCTYGGQLTLSLLCDRYCFGRQDARRLLDTYIARIRLSMADLSSTASHIDTVDANRGQ